MALCGIVLRPGAGIEDVENCQHGCVMDSSAGQRQMHPPHADLSDGAFKDGDDFGQGGFALELHEGVQFWGPTRCSHSLPLAVHKLESSAAVISPSARVQPLNYMISSQVG
ncbi:hypothetical protein BTVI_05845 [Pitangus sulphuratus]|nr:hypothetical protein BTVI_05845 [Pitangus sulphuratus]